LWAEVAVEITAIDDKHRLRRTTVLDGSSPRCVAALFTTQQDPDLAALDARHRAQARVEQRIRNAKTLRLRNLPSADFAINQIWLQLVLMAQDLLAWFAALVLDGDLAVAAPATVRYRLLHVAGRITRSSRRVTLHLDAVWPWATQGHGPHKKETRGHE
jgi:hypothetical protein